MFIKLKAYKLACLSIKIRVNALLYNSNERNRSQNIFAEHYYNDLRLILMNFFLMISTHVIINEDLYQSR